LTLSTTTATLSRRMRSCVDVAINISCTHATWLQRNQCHRCQWHAFTHTTTIGNRLSSVQ
jgi:fructose 1,6-bisphosphatase